MVKEYQSLRSINSDEFLPSIARWTYLGGFLLSGTVSAAVLLSAIIRYNVTVKAPATVRPVGEIKLVQASFEGTVSSIEVKENQSVKQDDIIARIDDSKLQIQKSQLQKAIEQNHLQLTQITAQIDALDTQRVAEMRLISRNISVARADLDFNQRNYHDEQISTQTEVEEAQAALELARVEMKQYQQLTDTGAVAQLEVQQKEQAFKAALAKLERARAKLNPSNAEVIIAREHIAQEAAKGESMLATLNQKREELYQQHSDIQGQIDRDLQTLKQVNTDLEKTIIRAPVAGEIFRLGLRNSQQVVKSGEMVAQIAPTHLSLVVKAQVLAQDIGQVKICHQDLVAACKEGEVRLRISAYPHSDYGTLGGAVRAISPDAIVPDSDGTNPVSPFYEVTIEPEHFYLEKGEHKYLLKSGMQTTAEIISRKETVLTYILRKAKLLANVDNLDIPSLRQ